MNVNQAQMALKAIDTHAHIFRSDLPMAEGRRYAPDYNALPESFISNLDNHSFGYGVLIQPSFLGTDNRFMLQALKNYPDRLRGVAVVSPEISEAELDELGTAGVVGIRLNLIGQPLADYRQQPWKSLFAKLARRQWHVEIQREIDDLAGFLPAVLESGVTVVIDHFGRTLNGIDRDNSAHRRFLELLKDHDIRVKISAAYRCHAGLTTAREMLDVLRNACGHSEHLLWGSDWPHTQFEEKTSYSNEHAFMEALLTDGQERHQILVTNPTQLFKF